MDNSPFRAILNTTGRKTSNAHSVELLAVRHDGKIYFSRHRPDSDWFKNALADPRVTIRFNGRTYRGNASLVKDEEMNQKISHLKYPGKPKASEKRVSIQVTLCE